MLQKLLRVVAVVCSGVVVVICSLCFSNCNLMFQLFFLFVIIICLRSFNFIILVLELLSFIVVVAI